MPHFLIKKEEIKQDSVELLNNENFFHIVKVLRAKIGEKIKFIDDDRMVYFCEITEISKSSLIAKIIEKNKTDRILNKNLCLIQSILMNDAQNLAIANAVQTGVKRIFPVLSDNVSAPKASLKDKVSKWQKIAVENFKQCERGDMPEINEIISLKDALSQFKKENILIFAEKYDNKTFDNCLDNLDLNSPIALVIGPEGGFSQKEFDYFIEADYKLITLGKMIYKAPNAIVAGISNIVSRLEC